ncbi:MAG: transcriptional regulator, partial [Acidobacteriota bacterium]
MDAFETAGSVFRVGEWTVEPDLLRLTRGDRRRIVGAKVLGVLQVLAERPGEMVSKDALVSRVWGDGAASDESLTTVIYELRRALGDDARSPRFVGTIRGRGYRLLVTPEPVPAPARPVPADGAQEAGGPPASPRPRRAPVLWGALAAALGFAVIGAWGGAPPSAPGPVEPSIDSIARIESTPATAPGAVTAGASPEATAVRSVAVLALEPRGENPSHFAREL